MKPLFKYAQEGLAEYLGYKGPIDGKINARCAELLLKIHFIDHAWEPERQALAYAQYRLNTLESQRLVVDGLMGPKTLRAWEATAGKHGPPVIIRAGPAIEGWMPDIIHTPRWNHDSRPTLKATSIILHRTAGHFATGDSAVGRYGHPAGPRRKGSSLGFHFLVGKNKSESIQFCSIKKRVSHVRKHAHKSVGIEISGDIGQYRDGLVYGEDLTDWQVYETARIIKWIAQELEIPLVRIDHNKRMFTHDGSHRGLLAHRDLTENTHADSPNEYSWRSIMALLAI